MKTASFCERTMMLFHRIRRACYVFVLFVIFVVAMRYTSGDSGYHRNKDFSYHGTKGASYHGSNAVSYHGSKDVSYHGSKDVSYHGSKDVSYHGSKDVSDTFNGNWSNILSVGNRNMTAKAVSRWIVISLSVTPKMHMGYVFCIPLTVAAWKRIGWHTLILLTGDIEHWNNSTLLKLVKQTTLDLDPATRFVTIPVSHNPVSYAQVSRSFAVLFAHWIQSDDIIMTSDIDIVPLNGSFYDKVSGNEIFILNADCCSSFPWKGVNIKMQPMTSIGMSARNWITVMDLKPLQRNETVPLYIDSWLQMHYGKSIPNKDVVKGENEDWYLDQRVVSIQLHYTNIKQNKIRRVTKRDRVDRIYAGTWRDFKNHVDAHMFLNSFQDPQWDKTLMLISDIFTKDVVNKLTLYKEKFVKLR